MRDIDVRKFVHARLLKKYHDNTNAIVVDEFSLNMGAARADITVINGILHGYELKSRKDTLTRLPSQVNNYSDVMDKVTLVVDEHHIDNALKIIPDWWGVKIISTDKKERIYINNFRKSGKNPSLNANSLVKLLWKDECLILLEKMNLLKGNKSKPRYELWEIISENASLSYIRREVRHFLISRKNWRITALPESN